LSRRRSLRRTCSQTAHERRVCARDCNPSLAVSLVLRGADCARRCREREPRCQVGLRSFPLNLFCWRIFLDSSMSLAIAHATSTPTNIVAKMGRTLARLRARRDNPTLRWTHSSARLERLPHMPFRAISHTNPIRKTPKNQGRSDSAGDGRQLSPNEPTAQNRHSGRHHKRPVLSNANWLRLVVLHLTSLLIFAREVHVYVHHLWRGDHLTLASGLKALKLAQRVVARPFNCP